MNTKSEILDFLQSHKLYLSKEFHVKSVGLFGSFARDEADEDSDIDILIELENGTENIHELKQSLQRFLSARFGRNVDLARSKYLKPYAKEAILKDTIYV